MLSTAAVVSARLSEFRESQGVMIPIMYQTDTIL